MGGHVGGESRLVYLNHSTQNIQKIIYGNIGHLIYAGLVWDFIDLSDIFYKETYTSGITIQFHYTITTKLLCPVPRRPVPFRSISRRSIRFDFIPFRSNLSFQSVPIYSAPPHSIFLPFYSILFQSISLRSIFTQFCFIPSRYLLHSIPCHSILFCSDPFRPVLFDSVPFFVRFLPIPFCSVPIRPSFIQFHSTVLWELNIVLPNRQPRRNGLEATKLMNYTRFFFFYLFYLFIYLSSKVVIKLNEPTSSAHFCHSSAWFENRVNTIPLSIWTMSDQPQSIKHTHCHIHIPHTSRNIPATHTSHMKRLAALESIYS